MHRGALQFSSDRIQRVAKLLQPAGEYHHPCLGGSPMRKDLFALLLVVFGVITTSHADAVSTCAIAKCTYDGLVQVFEQGIELNEEFKKSASESDKSKYRQLSPRVEEYYQKRMWPAEERAATILAKHADPKLALVFLRGVLSFANFADESLADVLGRLYGKNPNVIIQALRDFSDADRKIVVSELTLGWGNVKSDFNPKIIDSRDARLHELAK